MAYFNEFPYTRNYDQDLGWLIREVIGLNNMYQSILDQLEELQEKYDTIPQQIANAIANYQTYVNGQLDNVRNQIANMNDRMDNFENVVYSLKESVIAATTSLTQYIDAQYDELYTHFTVAINNIVKNWPSVTDPSDGKREDLQTTLDHMWNRSGFGIPVVLFDSLNVPAEEFDNMQIPVWYFDRYAYWIFQTRRACYMLSPFTGEYVPIYEVVIALANLHQDGVTVDEFDAANIDVTAFDNANITAYNFDWSHEWFDSLTA